MQIARDKRLTNVSQGKHLPPSWTTLYELTKLDDDAFDQKLRDGSVNPEMQRKDVAGANRILNRERDRQRVENLPPIRASAKTGKQVSAISGPFRVACDFHGCGLNRACQHPRKTAGSICRSQRSP